MVQPSSGRHEKRRKKKRKSVVNKKKMEKVTPSVCVEQTQCLKEKEEEDGEKNKRK